MSLLIKETLSGNKVISSLQELRKDDWLAIKAYIYRVYLPYKNRVVWSSSITFNKSGTFLTTPISEEEGGDGDICWILLKELPTNDATPEVSRALQEENEASQSLQEGVEASRAP